MRIVYNMYAWYLSVCVFHKMPRNQRGGQRGPLTRAAARLQGPQLPVVVPPRGRGRAPGRGIRVRARGGRGAAGVVVQPVGGRQRVAPPLPRGRARGRARGRRPVAARVRGRAGRGLVPVVNVNIDDNDDDDNEYFDEQDVDEDYLDPANEFEQPEVLQDQINELQERLQRAQQVRGGRGAPVRGRGRGAGRKRRRITPAQEDTEWQEDWESTEEADKVRREEKKVNSGPPRGPSKPVESEDETEQVLIDKSGAQNALKDLLGLESSKSQGDVLNKLYVDGFTLDKKTKAKIWSGAFVDLSIFASKLDLPTRTQSRYLPGLDSHITYQTVRPRQANNFEEWLTWWSVYASVYNEQYYGAASEMFSYQNRIYELYKDEVNTYVWRHYDFLFRHAKSKCLELKWETVNAELLRKARMIDTQVALSYRRARGNTRGRGRGRGRGTVSAAAGSAATLPGSKGTCNRYNKGQVCPFQNCIFAHVCSICRAVHPKVSCPQAGTGASTSTATQ